MKRRWDFRNTIQEESHKHRRVYTKPDFVGHNITNLLKTRSIQGQSRRTTKRLRHFAEYSSVTQYQSAFLSHLGGKDEVVNGQRAQSSQAVSTISVAFSPCGLTMASTHGGSHCQDYRLQFRRVASNSGGTFSDSMDLQVPFRSIRNCSQRMLGTPSATMELEKEYMPRHDSVGVCHYQSQLPSIRKGIRRGKWNQAELLGTW